MICLVMHSSHITFYSQLLSGRKGIEALLTPIRSVFPDPLPSKGWIYGTSLTTGCSGLLPENYITKADECSTWIFHG